MPLFGLRMGYRCRLLHLLLCVTNVDVFVTKVTAILVDCLLMFCVTKYCIITVNKLYTMLLIVHGIDEVLYNVYVLRLWRYISSNFCIANTWPRDKDKGKL